jgi:hypothetical protein
MERVGKSDQIVKEEEGVFLFFSFRSAFCCCCGGCIRWGVSITGRLIQNQVQNLSYRL